MINIKSILEKLFAHQPLTFEEARNTLLSITRGQCNEAQISAFLAVFRMRPVTIEEIRGFREALLQTAIPFRPDAPETIDIVGTGGDGKNTFNISTTTAFVVAGAGYKVSKHGSYGVSSSVGSSNVLQALGYNFTTEGDTLQYQLEKANICFLHAPLFHPSMKSVVPVRKNLGIKTFFNILGPLVNPVQPTHQLLGTFNLEVARLYYYVMQSSGKNYTVVYSLDGYDEVSLTGGVKTFSPLGETLLFPKDFGIERIHPIDLDGGESPKEAARILLAVLENNASEAQKKVVCANAALAIQQFHPERPLADCVAQAAESIESGKARQSLKKVIEKRTATIGT
jgi:anthranilate phosphoribosyltransferase